MADSASGQSDRSIQVKLVLLGTSSKNDFLLSRVCPLLLTNLPGEAAVGKSSVVLRFVCVIARSETSPSRPLTRSTSLL